MRDYSSFSIDRQTYNHRSYFDIKFSILQKNQKIGYIKCYYFKRDKSLIIEDMNTRSGFQRKGLGLLRISEVLKFLKERNLKVKTAEAADVGAYYSTRASAEAFLSSLGFKEGEDDLSCGGNWCVDGKTLETKLKEKL